MTTYELHMRDMRGNEVGSASGWDFFPSAEDAIGDALEDADACDDLPSMDDVEMLEAGEIGQIVFHVIHVGCGTRYRVIVARRWNDAADRLGQDAGALAAPIPADAACLVVHDSGAYVGCVACMDSVGARTSGWNDDGVAGYGWPRAVAEGLASWVADAEAIRRELVCESCTGRPWVLEPLARALETCAADSVELRDAMHAAGIYELGDAVEAVAEHAADTRRA